jgi:hypothetical protein
MAITKISTDMYICISFGQIHSIFLYLTNLYKEYNEQIEIKIDVNNVPYVIFVKNKNNIDIQFINIPPHTKQIAIYVYIFFISKKIYTGYIPENIYTSENNKNIIIDMPVVSRSIKLE